MASNTREAAIKRLREEFMNRRGSAYEEHDRRVQTLMGEIDGLYECETELAKTSTNIMGAAMSEGNLEEKIARLKSENKAIREKRAELLVKNGYPADYLDLKFMCDKCRDTGFVGIDMCSCFKRELSLAMLSESGLGGLAKSQSFESFDFGYYMGEDKQRAEFAFKTLKAYAENFPTEPAQSFILIGDTGLGKTHLSTATAVKIIERGYEVCYVTMQTMLDDFSDCQFRGEGRETLRKYYDSDLLIIDDMGVELTNQFTVASLYSLINHRFNNNKPLIISTNLSKEEMMQRYDNRNVSRILGNCKPLIFKGRDVRMQKIIGKK